LRAANVFAAQVLKKVDFPKWSAMSGEGTFNAQKTGGGMEELRIFSKVFFNVSSH